MQEETINELNSGVSNMNNWVKFLGIVAGVVFSATMIYFQINDNTQTIEINHKFRTEEIKVINARIEKRYTRQQEAFKELREETKRLTTEMWKLKVEQAYIKGLRDGQKIKVKIVD